ncbi:MAG: universal stress protein, partial [Gemmatimonadaceae bacterium]|nr:universal stress protein [Gemmatimonadaceae bacterium]
VRIEMLAGDAAEALASAASAAEADLICIGRPRSRRGSARFGATTAHRLIARSAVPVLVVPAEQRGAPSRIVAAIDDGRAARGVIDASLALAAAHEATVEGLHVLSPELESMARSARLDARGSAGAWPGARQGLRDEEELLQLTREWIERQLRADRRVQSGAHARVGDVGQEIMAGAQSLDAGLIVMGRGGELPRRARDDALPVGSTTRMVTWAATCPVLVVPGERVLASTPRTRKIGFARGMTPAAGPPDAA